MRRIVCMTVAAAGLLAAVSLSAAQAPTAPPAPAPIITQAARFLPVVARNGMVASQEKHGTRVGVDILRRGGNGDAFGSDLFSRSRGLLLHGDLNGFRLCNRFRDGFQCRSIRSVRFR